MTLTQQLQRSVKVYPPVKARLGELKQALELKSESDVISYLQLFFDARADGIKLQEHKKILQDIDERNRQMVLEGMK